MGQPHGLPTPDQVQQIENSSDIQCSARWAGCDECDGTINHHGRGGQQFLYKGMNQSHISANKIAIPVFDPAPGDMVLDPATKHTLHPAPGVSSFPLRSKFCSCLRPFRAPSSATGCKTPNGKKPTVCKSSLRTVNTQADCGSADDFYYWTPWRAPGSAPVIDSCKPDLCVCTPSPSLSLKSLSPPARWFRWRSLSGYGNWRSRSAISEYLARQDRAEGKRAASPLFRQSSNMEGRIGVRSRLDGTFAGRRRCIRRVTMIVCPKNTTNCDVETKICCVRVQVAANHGGGCAHHFCNLPSPPAAGSLVLA